jgi:hypothetical protein
MDKIRDKWVHTALLSGSKINKKEVKKGIEWLYKMSNLDKPVTIFLDNPLHLQYGANLIKNPSQVDSQVRSQVDSQVDSQVRSQVDSQVDSQVYSQVLSQVDSQVDSQVYSQVRSQVYSQVRSQVDSQVDSQVYSQVDSQVDSQVYSQKLEYFTYGYEQLSYLAGWSAYLDFFSRVLKLDKKLKDDVRKYLDYMESGQFFVIFLKGFAFVCPRPSKVYRDAQNRLHSTEHPAVSWKGYELYFLNGLCFEKSLWEKVVSGKMPVEDIFAIENAEQRRVAYEVMEKTRMKELKDYKVLDEVKDDGYGYSMKVVSFKVKAFNEPLKYLNCFCPSTGREYYIETRQDTCTAAKNKSFGLDNVEFLKEL